MAILLFAGDRYYPSGGCNDLIGVFELLEEAILEGERLVKEDKNCYWYNIMEGNDGRELHSGWKE